MRSAEPPAFSSPCRKRHFSAVYSREGNALSDGGARRGSFAGGRSCMEERAVSGSCFQNGPPQEKASALLRDHVSSPSARINRSISFTTSMVQSIYAPVKSPEARACSTSRISYWRAREVSPHRISSSVPSG